MDAGRKARRAERFDTWVRRNPLVLVLVLVAFLVTTTITVAGPVADGVHWYRVGRHWRAVEYGKLNALHAGFTVQRFEQVLGAPLFRRPSNNGRWVESSFQGRGYWVQTVSDHRTDEVALYAVTSCDTRFNPTFEIPDGTRVTLNGQTLADVRTSDGAQYTQADYFAPAATADAHFIDYAYGGNPSNYKSFGWGFNDACVNLPDWSEFLPRSDWPFGFDGEYRGPAGSGGPELQAFRRRIPVNTYAETSPGARYDFFDQRERLFVPFQTGVDRILIRTVIQPSYGPPSTYRQPRTLPPPPVRRAYGSAALQKAWRCLHKVPAGSSYEFGPLYVFDKLNFMLDPGQRPPAPILRAPDGFLVVRGLGAGPTANDIHAAIGFFHEAGAATAAARAVGSGARAAQVDRKGKAVIAWFGTPGPNSRTRIMRCVPPA